MEGLVETLHLEVGPPGEDIANLCLLEPVSTTTARARHPVSTLTRADSLNES